MKLLSVSACVVVCLSLAVMAGTDPPVPDQKDEASNYSSPRIDFGILVSDVKASARFYEGVLGMKTAREFTLPAEQSHAVGLTTAGPVVVRVMVLGDGPEGTNVKLVRVPGTRPSRLDQQTIASQYGIRYLTLHVTDLQAALERAAAQGVKPIAEGPILLPKEMADGVGLAVLRDPDGNMIELVGPLVLPSAE